MKAPKMTRNATRKNYEAVEFKRMAMIRTKVLLGSLLIKPMFDVKNNGIYLTTAMH